MPVATGSNGESRTHAQRTIKNPGEKCLWQVLITANVIVHLVQELQTGTEAQCLPECGMREGAVDFLVEKKPMPIGRETGLSQMVYVKDQSCDMYLPPLLGLISEQLVCWRSA